MDRAPSRAPRFGAQMSRALPPQTPMSRAERQRLERERSASARRGHAQRLHRKLREQSAYILPHPDKRIVDCQELRDLIATGRAKGRGRFQFRGLWFSVRSGGLASSIHGPSGHLVSFWTLP